MIAENQLIRQFPWDRYGENNQNSSCWIRVSAAWAGNQLGAMHLPRIGEEVLVDFLGGDPELPFVKGRLFNALNMPPWSLPEQQALSGFRSRELIPGGGNSAAGRSNHFILDDTEQKIQAQLKSDHQHSQLSLGHITRIEDNAGRKDARGEGFELRTDGHGVLRAKDGLLITTEARPNAQAHAKDMGETTARLSQAQDQHASLGDLAAQHLAQDATDQGDVAKDVEAQNKAIKGGTPEQGKFPEFAEPHITFASPTGIASTTPGTTHQHSGRHHAITSGGHTSISAAKSFLVSAKEAVRIFTYKTGIKLMSWGGDIEAQALEKSIHILSKVSITETAENITLTAKEEFVVNGGGSYSVLNANLTHGTAGVWDMNAATIAMDGPKSLPVAPIPVVTGELAPGTMLLNLRTHAMSGKAVSNQSYELYKGGALVEKGITNDAGQVLVKKHVEGTPEYTVKLFNGDTLRVKTSPDVSATVDHRWGNKGFRDIQDAQSRMDDYGIQG